MDYFENESGLDPAEIAQASPQGIDAARPSRRRSETEGSDVSDIGWLRRACRGRARGGTTAKQHDEVAAPHGAYPSAEDDNLPRCQWTARLYAWPCHPLFVGATGRSVAGSVARGAKAEGAE